MLISDVGILEVVADAGTIVDNALDLALDHPGLVGLSQRSYPLVDHQDVFSLGQKLHAGCPGAGLRCRDQLVVFLVAPVTVVVGVTSRFTVQEGDRVSVVGDPAGQGAFKVAGQDPVELGFGRDALHLDGDLAPKSSLQLALDEFRQFHGIFCRQK